MFGRLADRTEAAEKSLDLGSYEGVEGRVPPPKRACILEAVSLLFVTVR
jgi:hypothetical protein